MTPDQLEELAAIKQRREAMHPRELRHEKWPTLAADLDWLVMEVDRLREVNSQLRYEQEVAGLTQPEGDEVGEDEIVGRLIWRDDVEIHGDQQPAEIEVMWWPDKTEIHVWSATGLSVNEGFDVARVLHAAARFASAHPCCDLHNSHCEPPSELCCGRCSEADHPDHPAGVICVLDPAAPVRTL